MEHDLAGSNGKLCHVIFLIYIFIILVKLLLMCILFIADEI